MELLELFGCDIHGLEIFVTDQPGELVVVGGPGWPHRCDACNQAWAQARTPQRVVDLVEDRPRLVAIQ